MVQQKHVSRPSFIFCGGCGGNILHDTISNITTEQYPGFRLLGTNTDSMVLDSYFEEGSAAQLERWKSSGALKIVRTGEGITDGKGAGGDPEIGRRVAESQEFREQVRQFISEGDEVFITTSVGGGTGGGFAPVVAEIAKELEKTVLSLVITPHPRERRKKKAQEGLNAIRGLVPTTVFNNGYLDDFKKKVLKNEAGQKLSFSEAWRIVNRHSIVPMLMAWREIVQVPGDIKNLDQNDVRSCLELGNYVVTGLANVPKDKRQSITAQELADELLAAHFQDPGIIEQGLGVRLWVHGAFDYDLVLDVMDLISQRVCKNDPGKVEDVEINWGMKEKVDDEEMWMFVFIVAENDRLIVPATVEVPVMEAEPLQIFPTTRANGRNGTHRMLISFRDDKGHWMPNVGVQAEIAERYQKALNDDRVELEAVKAVLDEIEKATGHRPELPSRFRDRNMSLVG